MRRGNDGEFECVRVYNDVIVAYFKGLFRYSPEVTAENHEESQAGKSVGIDLNTFPIEYKSTALQGHQPAQIHFNIVLPSISRSSMWLLPFRFSSISCVLYAPPISSPR
jgi:hypothetical protein